MKYAQYLPWRERFYPLSCGIAVGIWIWLAGSDLPWQKDPRVWLGTVLTFFAILVGFLTTNQSILFSMGDHRAIRWLRASKVGDKSTLYDVLVRYFIRAIRLSLLASAICAIGLLIKEDRAATLILKYFPLLVGFLVYAVMAVYRVVHLMSGILRTKT